MVTAVTITIGKTICKFIGHLTFKLSLRSCYYYREKKIVNAWKANQAKYQNFSLERTEFSSTREKGQCSIIVSMHATNLWTEKHCIQCWYFSSVQNWKQSGQTSFIFWPLKVYWNDSPLIGISIHCVYKVNVWSGYSLSEMLHWQKHKAETVKSDLSENEPKIVHFPNQFFKLSLTYVFSAFASNKAKLKHKAQ